jgi:hypothetical protein
MAVVAVQHPRPAVAQQLGHLGIGNPTFKGIGGEGVPVAIGDLPHQPDPSIAVPKANWVDIGPYLTIRVTAIISTGSEGDFYAVEVNGEPGGTLRCPPGTPVGSNYRGHVPKGGELLLRP